MRLAEDVAFAAAREGTGYQFHHGIEIGAEIDKPQVWAAGQTALGRGPGDAH